MNLQRHGLLKPDAILKLPYIQLLIHIPRYFSPLIISMKWKSKKSIKPLFCWNSKQVYSIFFSSEKYR